MLILDDFSLKYAVNFCQQYSKQNIGVFTKTENFQNIIDKLKNLILKKEYIIKFDNGSGIADIIKFDNGSRIVVFDGDKSKSYLGFRFSFIIVDQYFLDNTDFLSSVISMENNYKNIKKPLTLEDILKITEKVNEKDLKLEIVDKNNEPIYGIYAHIIPNKNKFVLQLK